MPVVDSTSRVIGSTVGPDRPSATHGRVNTDQRPLVLDAESALSFDELDEEETTFFQAFEDGTVRITRREVVPGYATHFESEIGFAPTFEELRAEVWALSTAASRFDLLTLPDREPELFVWVTHRKRAEVWAVWARVRRMLGRATLNLRRCKSRGPYRPFARCVDHTDCIEHPEIGRACWLDPDGCRAGVR